jgi:thioesterase domain-containing protein
MVAQYVAAVRPIAGDGPLLLAGYSFGGLVALEMARTLGAEGAAIGLLAMIDSYPIESIWPRSVKLDCKWRQAMQRLGRLWRGGLPAIREYRRELQAREGGVRRSLFPFDPALPSTVWHVQLATEAALIAYRPTYYPGTVDFIAAARQSPSFPRHPRLVWGRLVARLNIHRVAATHLSMVAEDADRLAAMLTRLVERA